MTRNIVLILVSTILIKIIYVLFSVGIQNYIGEDVSLSYETVIDVFKKNDTFWYEKIALNGYTSVDEIQDLGYNSGAEFKQSEWAFFPMYPILINLTQRLTCLSIDSSLLLLSLLFTSLLLLLFYLFIKDLYNDEKFALYSVCLLIVLPFHYYFSVFYTEAIFLSFVIGSFYALVRKKYFGFSILIILMVLTRPNGVLILVPLYLFMLEQEGILRKNRIHLYEIFSKRNIFNSLYFISGLVAFLAYGIYQYFMTGEFFAFSIAQKGWYRDFMFPLLALFRHGDATTQFNSIYTIFYIILAIILWKKAPLSFNVFVWISLLLPLISGSVLSMPRFISVIFPFTLFLGIQLFRLKNKWSLIGFVFLVQLATFYFWVVGDPMSY